MVNQEIIKSVLDRYLGIPESKKDSNYAYTCPFCKHHKKKLEFDYDTGYWHCWVCHQKGRGPTFLLVKIGAPPEEINRVSGYSFGNKTPDLEKHAPSKITYPDNFEFFTSKKDSVFKKDSLKYLIIDRGLTVHDIIKYKLGYIRTGLNAGNIILPSYDRFGELNFYTEKNIKTGKYKNPYFSRNVIFYEFYINWKKPIILTEGFFDAITVQRNSIPLLGTTLSKKLRIKLINSKSNDIIICLDADALKQAIEIADYLISYGKNVYLTSLPNNTDPASLGRQEVWDYINNAELLDEYSLLKYKISFSM